MQKVCGSQDLVLDTDRHMAAYTYTNEIAPKFLNATLL